MKKRNSMKGIIATAILLLLAAGSVLVAYFSQKPQLPEDPSHTDSAQSAITATQTESEETFSTEVTDPEYSDVTDTGTDTQSGSDTDTNTTDTATTDTGTKDKTSTSTIPLKDILGHITPPPDGSPKKVAFTFDDGPYTPVTRGLVDEFAKYGGHCTFFVVGNRIYGTQKEAMKYASDNGNEIAIHAYTHNADYSKCTESVYQFEISKTAEEIKNTIGKTPTLMRPVGGSISNKRVAESPYSVILWNLDTKDWKYRNADTVARTILNSITAGDIVLLHDIYPSTLQAIKTVLPLLKEYGYEFVTVSELMGEEMQTGKKYSNAY